MCKHLKGNEFEQFSIGYCHFDGEFVKKFEDVGVKCIKSDENYSNFLQVLINNKIDIVHKQTGGGDNPAWVKIAKSYGIKVIETIHCPRRTAIPYDDVDAIAYTTGYTWMKNTSEYEDKMYQIQYALDMKNPKVILPRYNDKYPITVGRLGRIVPDKRPDVLLSLAERCMKDPIWKNKIKFEIAGMIPTDYDFHIKYGKDFKERVEKLPNVDYFGFVEDKYKFWKNLDICINPVWETSFDIVFLEAMAFGIPILTWDNSAAPYVVGNAGLVTEATVENMYQGLIKLAESPDLRFNLGKQGIYDLKNKYPLKQFIDAWKDLYRKVYYEENSANK